MTAATPITSAADGTNITNARLATLRQLTLCDALRLPDASPGTGVPPVLQWRSPFLVLEKSFLFISRLCPNQRGVPVSQIIHKDRTSGLFLPAHSNSEP